MICDKCGAEKQTKKDRLPQRWKRFDGSIWCDICWRKSYCLRAVTFRVASPIDHNWEQFRAVLKLMWGESTRLANWITTQCYVLDVHRDPSQDKCPKMPQVYLYPEARVQFATLPSQSVAAAEQAYKAKYRARRFRVLWTCEESLPNYRYPEPFSCPNQGWTASFDEWNRPVVSVRIGDARWTLRLRGGWRYKRQLRGFQQIVEGEACQGELVIYRKRANGGEGETTDREGGQRVHYYVFVKLVAWFPKTELDAKQGTLFVRTDSESLLVALNPKDECLWIWNADHVRRWVAEHIRSLNRWSDDQKADNMPPDFGARRLAAVAKYRHRIDSAINQAARHVVAYARRRRFASIRYDDTDKRYVARFPWHELRSRIATLCEEDNLVISFASGEMAQESQGSLATIVETEDASP